MKKKFLSLALAATMVLSMAACGDKNDSDNSGTSNSASADNTDESAASSGDESAPPVRGGSHGRRASDVHLQGSRRCHAHQLEQVHLQDH